MPTDRLDELMTQKELAVYFRRTTRSIRSYKRRGFPMPLGLATPRQLLEWARQNGRSPV